jgi:fused signal recognition particle receptor
MDQIDLLKALQKMMDDNQVKAEANRKADRERMEANQAKAEVKAEADRKADKEEVKANQVKAEAERKAHMQEMMEKQIGSLASKMDANQERMEAIVHSIRYEWDEKIQRRSENVTERQEIPKEGAAVASLECEKQGPKEMEANFTTCRTETMVCQEETTVASLECQEPTSKEGESEAERREVPKEEVAVKSSRVTKKRPRGRRIAAGRRVKPTKLIRGDGESRKKLVAACRKVSCRATVAWRKRSIFRDIRTQGDCGPRRKLGEIGRAHV